MAGGAIWYLGGRQAFLASLCALGFLAFMIPWPTSLVDRLSFPLQLTSSSYATMFGGALGLPLHREGVQISVVPDPAAAPIYSVVIARECSGLTSLIVLLALGYLAASFTRAPFALRALLMCSVIPLALFANAIRITVVLVAGARYSPAFASWTHDHEGAVLMLMCSLGLIAIRCAILGISQPQDGEAAQANV